MRVWVIIFIAFTCSQVYAVNVGVNQPEVKPEAVHVHDNGNVAIPRDAVHGEKDMIHTEPITGTIWAKAEVLPGGVVGTASTTAPLVNFNPTQPLVEFTAPKDMVEGHLNIADHANVNVNIRLMDKDAAHELGEAIKQLAASIQDVKGIATDATNEAKRFAMYFAGICGIGALLVCLFWFLHVRGLKKDHAEKLAAIKEDFK